jgi:hypothetical protein
MTYEEAIKLKMGDEVVDKRSGEVLKVLWVESKRNIAFLTLSGKYCDHLVTHDEVDRR